MDNNDNSVEDVPKTGHDCVLVFNSHVAYPIDKINDQPLQHVCGENVLKWTNVSIDVVKRKRFSNRILSSKKILNNVSGEARSGKMIAILGSSGCGKSSLLKYLFGTTPNSSEASGTLSINGQVISGSVLNRLVTFVYQDDIFFPFLTVKQQLTTQALLQTNKLKTMKNVEKSVNETLDRFKLRKIENDLIQHVRGKSSISGGEKRRLSFASEVFRDPLIFLSDEPTSGLDSFMAKDVILALRNIADNGKIVICAIHQPSSEIFHLFDSIYLMMDGQCILTGTIEECMDQFKLNKYPCLPNYNPADHFLSVLSTENPEKLKEKFILKKNEESLNVSSIEDTTQVSDIVSQLKKNSSKPSNFRKFRTVLQRSSISVKFSFSQVMRHLVVAIILGLIYLDTRRNRFRFSSTILSSCFFILINMFYGTIYGAINSIMPELHIYYREHKKKLYPAWMYFICKNIVDLPMAILIPFLYSIIFYFMANLRPQAEAFLVFYFFMFVVGESGRSLGYLLSVMTNNLAVASILVTPLAIPVLVYGGFFIQTDSIPIYFSWIPYVSWFNYAYKSIAYYQLVDTNETFHDGPNDFVNSERLMARNGLDTVKIGLNIAISLIIIVLIRLLAFFLLFKRSKTSLKHS